MNTILPTMPQRSLGKDSVLCLWKIFDRFNPQSWVHRRLGARIHRQCSEVAVELGAATETSRFHSYTDTVLEIEAHGTYDITVSLVSTGEVVFSAWITSSHTDRPHFKFEVVRLGPWVEHLNQQHQKAKKAAKMSETGLDSSTQGAVGAFGEQKRRARDNRFASIR